MPEGGFRRETREQSPLTLSAALPDPDFSIVVERRNGFTLVHAAGQLDLVARPLLEAALAQADTDGTVVVDFTAVTFCTSGVLGVLVAASLRASRLTVVARHRAVLRPLELLGLAQYLTIVPDLDLTAHGREPQVS
jgi:anti-anti-sigma factor